jgi:MFS family permease
MNLTQASSTKRQGRIFYGWWIVAVSFIIAAFTCGIASAGFTALFEPIARHFDWSYAQVSMAPSIQGLLSIVMMPLTGLLVHKFGTKRLVLTGVILLFLGFLLFSRINSLGLFYTSFVIISLGTSCASGVAMTTVLVHWFRRRVSLALGIMTSGSAIGGLLIPVVTYLVDSRGLITALIIFGTGLLVILLPLALIIRQRPEDYGMLPDGDTRPEAVGEVEEPLPAAHTVKLGIIVKSRIFWLIVVVFFFQMLICNTMNIHIMPYLSTIGVSRSVASLVASGSILCGLLGTLGLGGLGINMEKRRLGLLAFSCTVLAMLFLYFSTYISHGILVGYVICYGLAWGGGVVAQNAMINEYFGRARFALVAGLLLGLAQVGCMIGPPIAGWVYDNWHSYQGIWLVYIGISLISIVFAIILPHKDKTGLVAESVKDK